MCNKGNDFVQILCLGWFIIGEICLGKMHKPDSNNIHVKSLKTHVINNGRNTIFEPCSSNLVLKEHDTHASELYLHDGLFVKTEDNNKVAMSVEYREFLHLVDI